MRSFSLVSKKYTEATNAAKAKKNHILSLFRAFSSEFSASHEACYDRGAPLFFLNTTPHFRSLIPLPKTDSSEKT